VREVVDALEQPVLDQERRLAEREVGNLTIDRSSFSGALSYLRSCRNTSGLRAIVVEKLIEVGERTNPPSAAPVPQDRSGVPEGGPPWSGTDPGLRALDALHRGLGVDQAWCEFRERGFTWWAYRLAQHIDIAVVVSGDGDFAPAIRAVQQMGVRVDVISFSGNTSSDLKEVADDADDTYRLQQLLRRTIGRWISRTYRRRPMIVPVDTSPVGTDLEKEINR